MLGRSSHNNRDMGRQSGKPMQSLPDTLPSLMGFNKNLTPSWIESVAHIIKKLSSIKPQMNLNIEKAEKLGHDDDGDTELDATVPMIQDELVSLRALLKQITLQRRQSLNDYLDLKGNIRVFCRIRPFVPEESYSSRRSMFTLDESTVFLKVSETKSKQYKFDKVFPQCSTQDDVFSEVEPVIKSALDGYNVCIFAYGQTGSGKTYTMEGKPKNLGVVPRGIQSLFDRALESNCRFMFTFSMLEIYMGNLQDLLAPESKNREFKKGPSLSIQIDPEGGIEIENLVAIEVHNFQDVKRLYQVGSRLRSTASTMANSRSSRSHCMIRISLTSFNVPERKRARNKLWMIDLGGSERLLKTQATGKRLQEGKAINLSLSALGDVIDALRTKKPHIPYRNSKLTQVLRDSLGCDSKTLMLVHISPNEDDLCETICTLGFATRARNICLESDEPPEMKARKEHSLIELERKVNNLEHQCQDIRRKIKKLDERMEHLTGSQHPVSTNFGVSYLSSEELQAGISKNVKSLKQHREVSARLPRFMKPTASSQQRMGLNNHIFVTDKKSPPMAQKRRSSSVYAESVRSPEDAATWQSECNSECSISIASDTNWTLSIQDGSECSQDVSEYEIKQVIFSEEEKSPKSQFTSFTESHIGESENIQNNKLEEDTDKWVHLQTTEKTSTCRSKRVPAIPEVTETCNLFVNLPVKINHNKKEDEPYNSSVSPQIKMEWTEHCQDQDFNQVQDEANDLNLRCPKQYVKDAKEAKIASQSTMTELSSTPSKDVCSDEICSSLQQLEHKYGSLAHLGRCRRSLQKQLANCTPLELLDYKSKVDPRTNIRDAAESEISFQDKKLNKGKLKRLFQLLQIAWIGALLGLGIMSLGLEHDFFHSLAH